MALDRIGEFGFKQDGDDLVLDIRQESGYPLTEEQFAALKAGLEIGESSGGGGGSDEVALMSRLAAPVNIAKLSTNMQDAYSPLASVAVTPGLWSIEAVIRLNGEAPGSVDPALQFGLAFDTSSVTGNGSNTALAGVTSMVLGDALGAIFHNDSPFQGGSFVEIPDDAQASNAAYRVFMVAKGMINLDTGSIPTFKPILYVIAPASVNVTTDFVVTAGSYFRLKKLA